MQTLFKPDIFFTSSTAWYKPKIVSSACLLGEKVRYDGTSKLHVLIQQQLSYHCNIIPICPEAGSGMGVPRETIQLLRTEKGVEALNLEQPSINATDQLKAFAKSFLNQHRNIDGFVMKARSPSCGFQSTALHDSEGEVTGKSSGLFTHAMEEALIAQSSALIVEEEFFKSEQDIALFLFFCLLQKERNLIHKDTEKLHDWETHYQQVLSYDLTFSPQKLITNLPDNTKSIIIKNYNKPA